MRTRIFPVLFSLLLLFTLQSCGGMETIVSVYPDGSAQLAYSIEAPSGKMPDLEAMGKGDLAEIFKKDKYLSQEPNKLMDSLVEFAVNPLLNKLKSSGKIRDYSITDSTEFTSKKVRITLKLASYEHVGPIHSTFKREIPALDSIFRKLTKMPATAKSDSIAIVKLDDALEMQLYHFMPEPVPVEISREMSINKARHMMDSVFSLMTDSSSIFAAMMGPDEIVKLRDSMAFLRSTLTLDQLDSMGRNFAMMENMGFSTSELFKPKITLRAPMMIANNLDLVGGRITVTPKAGGMQFEPSMGYGELENPAEPFRQYFSIKMPPMGASTVQERADWRSILLWCDECEAAFESQSKPPKQSIVFHPTANGRQLLEVDCGMFKGEKAKMYYVLADVEGMPTAAVHRFPQSFYVDDPVSEMRSGSPRFVTDKSALIIGKVSYDKNSQKLTIDRGSAKETYDLSTGSPQYLYGSYKDKAGKWIKQEGYVNNASELFGSGGCADDVTPSSDLPSLIE